MGKTWKRLGGLELLRVFPDFDDYTALWKTLTVEKAGRSEILCAFHCQFLVYFLNISF